MTEEMIKGLSFSELKKEDFNKLKKLKKNGFFILSNNIFNFSPEKGLEICVENFVIFFHFR
jgi:hypothetical protein